MFYRTMSMFCPQQGAQLHYERSAFHNGSHFTDWPSFSVPVNDRVYLKAVCQMGERESLEEGPINISFPLG